MIFIYFKFIVANVFMINMHFSKINCSEKAIVALLKITFDIEKERFVPESVHDYLTRNTKLIDERTGLPYLFNVTQQRYMFDNEEMEEHDYYSYINNDLQLIMNNDQANDNYNLPRPYLTTINIMKQKEANLTSPNKPIFDNEMIYVRSRQVQFYRYLLYPFENENIYDYWNRVDTKLKSCLQNNDEFDFIDTKVQFVDYIRFNRINVPRFPEETDEVYAKRVQAHQKWFYKMISTKPLRGEGLTNYHLRNLRLDYSSLTMDTVKIFFSDISLNEKHSLKINEIKNNFFDTEFFVIHIIFHCKLPPSEFIEYTANEAPNKNKRERGESSGSRRSRGVQP